MNKTITAIFASILLFAGSQYASAQALFSEGEDYTVLANPLEPQKAGEKEVIEIFSYTCPHCYNLSPHMHEWVTNQMPENVSFYKIPATGGNWAFTAQVKYVADKLGLGYEFDKAYFEGIHKERQRRLVGDKDTAVAFIAEFAEIDESEVEKSWNSLEVKKNLKRSESIYQQAGVTGTPTIIVNGKYMVKLRGSYDRFFQVIDYLLKTTDVN